MKTICVVVILLASASAASAQSDFGLPDLHAIKTVTLSPSYSCRTPEEFRKGYEGTALFLSAYSKQRNSPDLLFNGACRSEDYFQASTAGDDMALVADLGEDVPLEKLTALDAYRGFRTLPASELRRAAFEEAAPVKLGHTYAVLLNRSDMRGLFVFTVTGYTQNSRVDLRYAVKEYQVLRLAVQSPGFGWTTVSSEKR